RRRAGRSVFAGTSFASRDAATDRGMFARPTRSAPSLSRIRKDALMAGSHNQGLQIAVIIFVILTVLSMGFSVMTGTNVRELRTAVDTERKKAAQSEQSYTEVQQELNFLKGIVGLKATDTGDLPDSA